MNILETHCRTALLTGIKHHRPNYQDKWFTADIEVYTPDQSSEQEATIHYEGKILSGSRDDRWGYVERETHISDKTWAEDADTLIDTVADLELAYMEITLVEIPEHIARDLAATLEGVVA